MIIATAGHVDHGKTRLVQALTGVDTDRLPEEKRRGLTIEPGFAYRRISQQQVLGFVDVPGHERFIHHMLGGVAGIDFALLVVAADDGPMPQTREHLSILHLLGVRRGAVALTKVDRVTTERVGVVEAETRALLAGTGLHGAPIFPCSAVTGAGIPLLAAHLEQEARAMPARGTRGSFRLAIDRSFHLAGAGLIVTGTAMSGSVEAGQTVRLLLAGTQARVRSIHAQDTPVVRGCAGERCALNLAGATLHPDQIRRGEWVVDGEVPPPTQRIDARLQVLAPQALAHWSAVHLHLGTAHVTGRVAVLQDRSIAAGGGALVQLVLDQPIGAVRGDRFIVRDASARQTVAGGIVIDAFAPARGRARPARLAWLAAMEADGDAEALAALLAQSPGGVDLGRFAANRNLSAPDAARLYEAAPMRRLSTRSGQLGFSPTQWDSWRSRVLQALADWHRRSPDAVGPAPDRVLAADEAPGLAREALRALVADLVREGQVVREITGVRLPGHRPQLRPADATLWQRLQPLLAGSGVRPPSVAELAASLGEEAAHLDTAMSRLAYRGLLVRVSKNRFFPPAALGRLMHLLRQEQHASGSVTAADFRDRAGIGRNLAIEVLEYFDCSGFTQRIGDARVLIDPEPGGDSFPGGAPGLQIR